MKSTLATLLALTGVLAAQDGTSPPVSPTAVPDAPPELPAAADAQQAPGGLTVGHFVEVRGTMGPDGRFVAEKVELLDPDDDILIGTVPKSDTTPGEFTLLGQRVVIELDTKWTDIDKGKVAGQRVEVEGSWKGPGKFAAKEIKPRGEGRDRIGARIDELKPVQGGWEARIMTFRVFMPDNVEFEHERPVEAYPLADLRIWTEGSADDDIERDEDDELGEGFELMPGLRISGQLEGTSLSEKDFDLDDSDDEDRRDTEVATRIRLTWTPTDKFSALSEARNTQLWRHDDQDGSSHDSTWSLGETWAQWRDAWGKRGFDVTLGRQDFDDLREWIFDKNLDAARVTWLRPGWRLDIAASTLLSGGDDRDEESWNGVAYLSNNNRRKHLAAYAHFRHTDFFSRDVNGDDTLDPGEGEPEQDNLHLGARAIGRWIPQNRMWADFAYLTGDRDGVDVQGIGYDVGTTWQPDFAGPLYFTLGYAFGSGDSNPGSSDKTFRQTGYQDNNGKFGGVTSFEYYGELLEPELSNLGIVTLGVGTRIGEDTSVDLVYHTYEQDQLSPQFSAFPVEADVDPSPNGLEGDLGAELDLIFGFRHFKSWDLEVVGAWFDPGDGFDLQEDAYMAKVQLRFRF